MDFTIDHPGPSGKVRRVYQPGEDGKVPCEECGGRYSPGYMSEHRKKVHSYPEVYRTKRKRDKDANGFDVPDDFEAFTGKLRKLYEKLDKTKSEHQDFMLEIAADAVDVLYRQELRKLKAKINERLKVTGNAEDEFDDDREGLISIRKGLMKTIIAPGSGPKMVDVVGLDDCKEALLDNAFLPVRSPQLFLGSWHPWKGILLFGPPGNGKTFLARAIANDLNLTFFSISASTIGSMWKGRSEKIVTEIFDLAMTKRPALIFLDEADTMCHVRDSTSPDSNVNVVSQFLIEVDGVGSCREGIVLMAATNNPWGIDVGMRRRFQKRLYVPLPDKAARYKVIAGLLAKDSHNLTEEEIQKVAKKTKRFSNSDLVDLFGDAKSIQTKEMKNYSFFKPAKLKIYTNEGVEARAGFWTPCDESARGSKAMRSDDFPDKVIPLDLSLEHFLAACKIRKPSTSKTDVEEYKDFNEHYCKDV